MIEIIKKELLSHASKEKAKILMRFFKTEKGEYGEGDIFHGIVVPKIRQVVAKYYKEISLSNIKQLLKSKFHEERLAALLFMVYKYNKANGTLKKSIFEIYINNTKFINNWDLVDLSAPNIVGNYLDKIDKTILYIFAKSKSLWERRISIISTFYFIRNLSFSDTLKLSKILLHDKEDLIHKAVGWMLREVGKRSFKTEIEFLNKHYKTMPRTMLRYAIEKFPEKLRQKYLKNSI